MNMIHEYVHKVHELVELPRNELRQKVYVEHRLEYSDLLEKFEQEYFEKCLKIEEMLEEEYERLKLSKEGKSSKF